MQSPQIAENESERIHVLRSLQILDSPPEERFDRITQLAAQLFDVPIALVSLVDTDRQWFKSCVGLDASQTDRNISFCGHALHSRQVFYVPNALEDPRFADNPLVTGPPDIRFYAGAPLTMKGGEVMGTLCIIDTRPRTLSDKELYQLQGLADWVIRELEVIHLVEESQRADRSESYLRSILQSVAEGIVILRPDGSIESLNRAAMEHLRVDQEVREHDFGTFVEMSGAEVSGVEASGSFAELLAGKAVKGERVSESREVQMKRLDHTGFPCELTISPAEVPEGFRWVVSFRDISDRVATERVNKEFISIVSHELRTPLTAIRGALGLIHSGKLNSQEESGKELLAIASRNTDRLLNLVNDILEIEKLDAGQISLCLQVVSADSIMQTAEQLNRTYASSHGIELVFRNQAADSSLLADPDRVQQVLSNLISNAVKYSPAKGTVEVIAELAGQSQILFSITDDGPGLSVHDQTRVFDRFYQVQDGSSLHRKGTGLGLSIVKALVEQMGGQMSVTSQPGQGSTFRFSLPNTEAEKRHFTAS